MKRLLVVLGRLAYWCAWPAFWVYFRRGYGRTRIIVQDGDKVLLVKQWIADGRWQLPGGGMHKGEPAQEAALRELVEETGIQLHDNQLSFVGEAKQRSHGATYTMYIFKTQWISHTLRLQRIELYDARWLRIEELTPQNTRPDALTALQMLQSKM